MNDLISRLSELRSQFNCFSENEQNAYHTLSEAIEALQEPKTGKWIDTEFMKLKECSICHARWGIYSIEEFDFCPTCGCKMEVEDETD